MSYVANATPWLVRTPAPNRRLRLFCFSYAGGNAFNFLRWQEAVDPAIEICAIQLPGRGARIAETPIASLPALLKAVAPVISRMDDLPYALFGHSVGALIAFELARYLRLHGLTPPQHLFVSGCHAPQFRAPMRELHTLSDEEFTQVLREYEGTPPEVLETRDLMALLLPAIRADFAIAEDYRYRHGPLLHTPITVFAGRDDLNKEPGQIDGWAKETAGECRVEWFDGGHFFIHDQRAALLARINAELTARLCV